MTENKTAFIAIVGRPNVGKSSILNKLLGQKIAIVSDKPQTTRTRIMGVLTIDETQLVFTDTPGFHRPKTKLGEKMVKAVSDSISGVDLCLFVIESEGELRETELELIEKFKQQKMPVVLAINKIDTLEDKTVLMKRIMDMTQLYDFEAIVPVSAVKNDGLDALTDELIKLAQPSEHFFPEDTLTDQPERVIVSEIIREKMLRLLDKEIPHGVAVAIEKMRECYNYAVEADKMHEAAKEKPLNYTCHILSKLVFDPKNYIKSGTENNVDNFREFLRCDRLAPLRDRDDYKELLEL